MARTIVHQLDKTGKCIREHHYHDRSHQELHDLHNRIERGFKMSSTMVTVNGHHAFGAVGLH